MKLDNAVVVGYRIQCLIPRIEAEQLIAATLTEATEDGGHRIAMNNEIYLAIAQRAWGIGTTLKAVAENMPEEPALDYDMIIHVGPKDTAVLTIQAEISEEGAALREQAFSLVYGDVK